MLKKIIKQSLFNCLFILQLFSMAKEEQTYQIKMGQERFFEEEKSQIRETIKTLFPDYSEKEVIYNNIPKRKLLIILNKLKNLQFGLRCSQEEPKTIDDLIQGRYPIDEKITIEKRKKLLQNDERTTSFFCRIYIKED